MRNPTFVVSLILVALVGLVTILWTGPFQDMANRPVETEPTATEPDSEPDGIGDWLGTMAKTPTAEPTEEPLPTATEEPTEIPTEVAEAPAIVPAEPTDEPVVVYPTDPRGQPTDPPVTVVPTPTPNIPEEPDILPLGFDEWCVATQDGATGAYYRDFTDSSSWYCGRNLGGGTIEELSRIDVDAVVSWTYGAGYCSILTEDTVNGWHAVRC